MSTSIDTLPKIKIWKTGDHIVLVNGQHSLWASRSNGSLTPQFEKDTLHNSYKPQQLGECDILIGKLKILPESDPVLLVALETAFIGSYCDDEIWCVTKVGAIVLSPNGDPEIVTAGKSTPDLNSNNTSSFLSRAVNATFSKVAARNMQAEKLERRIAQDVLKEYDNRSFYYCRYGDITASVQLKHKLEESGLPLKSWEPAESQFFWNEHMLTDLIECLTPISNHWIRPLIRGFVAFTSFSVPPLSTSIEKRSTPETNVSSDGGINTPFKNLDGLSTFLNPEEPSLENTTETGEDEGIRGRSITSNVVPPRATLDSVDSVKTENQFSGAEDDNGDQNASNNGCTQSKVAVPKPTHENEPFQIVPPTRRVTLCLISRRSKLREGTRFRRRGADENGNTANYVETELVIRCKPHEFAYVISRGSIPLLWTQKGVAYKPPVALNNDAELNSTAFAKHVNAMIERHSDVTMVDLLNTTPRNHETALHEAFARHATNFDSPQLTYISFDFHKQMRQSPRQYMTKFIAAIAKNLNDQNFYWMDNRGVICTQKGIFRINCLDCLDRTNVIQAAICSVLTEKMLTKIRVVEPEVGLPVDVQSLIAMIWRDNGNKLSLQYTGTGALKTAMLNANSPKFAGMMKDGVNSASRYFKNNFEDHYRQAALNAQLGVPVDIWQDAMYSEKRDECTHNAISAARTLIDSARRQSTAADDDPNVWMAFWPMIDTHPWSVFSEQEVTQVIPDTILMLNRTHLYVVKIDVEDAFEWIQNASEDDTLTTSPADINILWWQAIPVTCITTLRIGHEQLVPFGTSDRPRLRISYMWPATDTGRGEKARNGDTDPVYHHSFKLPNFHIFNSQVISMRTEADYIDWLKASAELLQRVILLSSDSPASNEPVGVPYERARTLPKIRSREHPGRVIVAPQLLPPSSNHNNISASFQKLGSTLKDNLKSSSFLNRITNLSPSSLQVPKSSNSTTPTIQSPAVSPGSLRKANNSDGNPTLNNNNSSSEDFEANDADLSKHLSQLPKLSTLDQCDEDLIDKDKETTMNSAKANLSKTKVIIVE